MKRFLLLLGFLVFGCCCPVDEGDEMGIYKPLQWGQTRIIQPGEWQRDRPITVVERTAEYSGDSIHVSGVKNPVVKNLTLGIDYDASALAGNFSLQWIITYGVGGGSDSFNVDANDLQQMSLSADQIRATLVSKYPGIVNDKGVPLSNPDIFVYTNPHGAPIEASAFYAEGMTSTDAPTLTQRFNFGPNTAAVIPIPKFVTSFRILGDPAGSSPFTVAQVYSLVPPDSIVIDSYTGDEIFGVRLAPIPTGNASSLQISNTDLALSAQGAIEWSLDL